MLDARCSGTYNVYSEAFSMKPVNEQAWVSELFDYGLDVVALRTGSTYSGFECYRAGDTWVRDLIDHLQELHGGEVCLFGHSAGGLITAYEIQERTSITAAVVVSAPMLSEPDALFETPTHASNVKANLLLQWGQQDQLWTRRMPEYYQNAQGCGHTIQRDDTYPGNLHDTYFTQAAQTQRNNAKAFLTNAQENLGD
jgi:pimeloyl-ACP methyl ester carboxylesterase